MTKTFCDDCGVQLKASWWNGWRWKQPDLDLCKRCYDKRCQIEQRANPTAPVKG